MTAIQTVDRAPDPGDARNSSRDPRTAGQIVLVLQGGGALGAYQAGVYQGLSEAGIEPDWVIGTSIGAINAALIAGNEPARRLARLREFWTGLRPGNPLEEAWSSFFGGLVGNFGVIAKGVPGFFHPNPLALMGPHYPVGSDQAAYYSTEPLRETLSNLIDLEYMNARHVRVTMGAVNARSGEMRYFDSRDMPIGVSHVMASGALPPAFPAVIIDGEPYWDGGIYSNTPVEVVFDDRPRRNGLIFSVNMWQPAGPAPSSIWQAMARQKDIQYSSRGFSHVQRQQQLHRLRHVIRELEKKLPAELTDDPAVRELAAYGCGTTMHLVQLLAPRLDNEDHTKDIDFSAKGIELRWRAGHDYIQRVLARQPWNCEVDPLTGIMIHRDE